MRHLVGRYSMIVRIMVISLFAVSPACTTYSTSYRVGSSTQTLNKENAERALVDEASSPSSSITCSKLDPAAPRRIYAPLPAYPPEAIEAKIEGDVEVEFILNEVGTTTDVKALRSPHHSLSEAAINAVRQWRFCPVILNGSPTKVRMIQPLKFKTP